MIHSDKKRKEPVEPAQSESPRAKLTPGIYISTPDEAAERGPQTREIPEALLNAVTIPMPETPVEEQPPVTPDEPEQENEVSLKVLSDGAESETAQATPAQTEPASPVEETPEAPPAQTTEPQPDAGSGAAIVESPASTTPQAAGFIEELRKATEEARRKEEAVRQPEPAVTIPEPPAP